MSKTKTTKPVTSTDVIPKDGEWIDLENERFMWAASEGRVLQGYLLTVEHIEPKSGRPFAALLIRTTTDTALIDRDGEEIMAPPGTDVLVPVTARLQNMVKLAEQPHDVYEVRIQALRQVDIGGGQKMWTYKAASKSHPVPRTMFGPMFAVYSEVPELPAANENGGAASFPAT